MITRKKFFSSFSVLYDLSDTLGCTSLFTPYSILRAELPRNQGETLKLVDFCVIWDEAFGDRLARLVLKIYRANLLEHIKYIGARQGCLTVIVSDAFFYDQKTKYKQFCAKIERLANNVESDPWVTEIGRLHIPHPRDPRLDSKLGLIPKDPLRVYDFLFNVDKKWKLGHKKGA